MKKKEVPKMIKVDAKDIQAVAAQAAAVVDALTAAHAIAENHHRGLVELMMQSHLLKIVSKSNDSQKYFNNKKFL